MTTGEKCPECGGPCEILPAEEQHRIFAEYQAAKTKTHRGLALQKLMRHDSALRAHYVFTQQRIEALQQQVAIEIEDKGRVYGELGAAQQRIEEWKQRLWNLEDAVETEGEKTDAQLDAQREQIDTLLARVERAERDFEKAVKGLEANAKYIRKQDDEIDAMRPVCGAAEALLIMDDAISYVPLWNALCDAIATWKGE